METHCWAIARDSYLLFHAFQTAIKRKLLSGLLGRRRGLTKDRFETIRTSLADVPQSSTVYGVAQRMLRTVEASNASILVDYFPPDTFTSRAPI